MRGTMGHTVALLEHGNDIAVLGQPTLNDYRYQRVDCLAVTLLDNLWRRARLGWVAVSHMAGHAPEPVWEGLG
jgi:hypothetical protein